MDKEYIEITEKLIEIVDQLLKGNINVGKQYEIKNIPTSNYEELNRLAEKLILLRSQYKEGFRYMVNLTHGNLDMEVPRSAIFAGPYKQLQSELRHLKWIVSEVAKGDYNQQVSFIGDLSVAFNKMIEALREKHILEKQLKETTEELGLLNKTKDRFFSIIAHDLKNPFNAIVGYSELLTEAIDNSNVEDFKEMAQIIQHSATQGYELLTNLLEWSRQQSGRIKMSPQLFNIESVIRYNLEIVYLSALSKNITINNISNMEESQVYTDQAILNTIFRNLIGNAIKYTPEGGTISVDVKKEADYYLISIKDSGIGISKEDIQKLFRIDTIHTTKGTNNEGGTGLGLILCYEFVRMLGGKIWVESEPNHGSTFFFTLPDIQK